MIDAVAPRPNPPVVTSGGLPNSGPAWLLRVLAFDVLDQLRAIVREPTTLFFSVAMPVGFFALFAGLWGTEATADGGTVATSMLATFGTFGVVGVTLLTPGLGVADDRERGWLRAKRVSATPLPVTLVGASLATVPYAVGVLGAMTGVAAMQGNLAMDASSWFRLVSVLVVGALPLALFGLAVGLRFAPNPAAAILNAVFIPSAVASGLWIPLEMLPDAVTRIAPFLPTHHLAQLALAQLGDIAGSVAGHVVALVATTIVGGSVAAVAYRRARP